MKDGALRVLHVTPYYEPAYVYGGPTRSVPALCRAVAGNGCCVTVFTTMANGAGELDVPAGELLVRDDVAVRYFRCSRPRYRFRAPTMARALQKFIPHCDLVHITGLWTYPASVAAVEAARARVPYVISPRGMLMPWEVGCKAWKKAPYLRLRELPQLRSSAGVHCTTSDELNSLARFHLEDHGFVVPNIVDPDEFSSLPPRGGLRARLGIPDDALAMLYLGRLHPKKGIELALDTFHHLAQDDARSHLMLVGPDEARYGELIPRWAAERGLGARVHVTGELLGPDRLQAYADADLFVSLSGSENFGLAVAEAMACGLPVAVRRGVGLSGAVERSGAGIAVEPTPEEACASIAALLTHPQHLPAMREAGRQLVTREFSPASIARRMLAAYAGALEKHAHAVSSARGESVIRRP